MTHSRLRFWGASMLAVLAVVSALALLAAIARAVGSPHVIAALTRNSETIGTALRIQFERAFAVGIALENVAGIDDLFRAELQRRGELSFFGFVGGNGQVVSFVHRDRATPAQRDEMRDLLQKAAGGASQSDSFIIAKMKVAAETPNEATLVIGYPINYIDEQVNAVVLDLVVAVLIALILVTEFLRFVSRRFTLQEISRFRESTLRVKQGEFDQRAQLPANDPTGAFSKGIDDRLNRMRVLYQESMRRISEAPEAASELQRAVLSRLKAIAARYKLDRNPTDISDRSEDARIRLMAFLMTLSEELTRPFFAVHAASLDGPLFLSNALLASIPLTTFLLTWALSQPLGPMLLRLFGATRTLVGAAILVGVGLFATAATDNWIVLVVLRAVTGFAFGCVIIIAQAMMLRVGRSIGKARAMAEFTAAGIAAGICGPVIGGLIAVKFGVPFAFVVAGACALASILLVARLADSSVAATGPSLSLKATLGAMRDIRFALVMLFATVPVKLSATAVLLILVPLTTTDLGESPAVAGRLLLLFFLALFLFSGMAARWSDRWDARKPFIVFGISTMALACVAAAFMEGIWGLAVLCALLGFGQAWVTNPLVVEVTEMAEARKSEVDSDVILGFYRLVERIGGATGPILAALLIRDYGLRGATLALGAVLGAGCIVTALVLWWGRKSAAGIPPPHEARPA